MIGPFSIINYGGPPGGIGVSIVKPAYNSGTITCGDKPPPSSESKLKLADDADQPVLMCPGILVNLGASCKNIMLNTSNTQEKKQNTYAIQMESM